MSIIIPRNSITQQQVELIVKHLTIVEKISFMQKRKYPNVKPKEVQMFQLKEDNLYLPYMFGCSLLQTRPNDFLPHKKIDIAFTGSLLDRQLEVVDETLEQLNTYGTTTLSLPPGWGKTAFSTYLSSKLGYTTLVIYHRTILGQQWKSSFSERTNAKIWCVEETPHEPEDGYDVILCMDGQIEKLFPHVIKSIGTLITDESHLLATSSRVECLLYTQPRYVIALSATLERQDGMHQMIQSIVGLHKIVKKIHKPFTVHHIHTGIVPESVYNSRGDLDWSNFIKGVLMNERRNTIILELVKANRDKKILILTTLVEHVMILMKMIEDTGIKCDFMARNKRKYQDSPVLVGSISKISTGFDVASSATNYDGTPIDYLIFATSFKDENLFTQTVGRVMRATSPHVSYIQDNHPILKKHWKMAEKFCKETGAVIQDINVSPDLTFSINPTLSSSSQSTIPVNTEVQCKSKTITLNYTPVSHDEPTQQQKSIIASTLFKQLQTKHSSS